MNRRPAPRPPCHVVAAPGDRDALCGERDPLPRVALEHVATHVEGWNMPVCDDCTAALANLPADPIPGQLTLGDL